MNENLEQKLLSNKIKPTSIRLLVLQKLTQRSSAIGLTELENSFELVDRTTLYRTLKTFEESKIIHSIEDGTGVTKYALCLESCNCELQDLHYHFHCTQCENTFCLTTLNIPTIDLPTNFKMNQANMVIKGLCANCNN